MPSAGRLSPTVAQVVGGLRQWPAAVVDFLYPPICILCLRRLERGRQSICLACENLLRVADEWRCRRCGAHGSAEMAPAGDRPCRLCPPAGAHYQGVLAVVGYNDASQALVHRFKYHRRLEVGEAIARLMADDLRRPLSQLHGRLDCVAPVPLHWRRRWERGFNQSLLLARAVSQASGIELNPALLRRKRHTRRQALVPRASRAQNVRGAFALAVEPGALAGRGVLLVDDVVTTGSTIEECARVLRAGGAREVWVACFARAGMATSLERDQIR
ncbi:MAG TPA: ComF family protein [Candidatus Sumerlaeota bacterium]|nr:ComF family protein [Candidatus Sumerlaeota bacterium]HOR28478.1 ComF family protein [Candidatus Sumerlaeota bacterium]HPK03368.1 ComF family protein [Candidatus Sumerlaeota bacterium]